MFCAPFFTHVRVSRTEGIANFSFASRLASNPHIPDSLRLLRVLDESLKVGQLKLNTQGVVD